MKSSRTLTLVLGAAAALSFIGTVAVYVAHFGTILSSEHNRWGEFGEYLGGVLGPILSLGALFGVLWTVRLQMRSLDDARYQQTENTFFQLLRRLQRIRDAPTSYAENKPEQARTWMPYVVLASEAWNEWIRLMRERPAETTETAARAHLIDVASELIKSKYNPVTLITDELMRLYGYVYSARIPEITKALYVQLINGEVSTIERTLLLFTLLTQPEGSFAFKVANSLGVFFNLDLSPPNIQMPEVYRRVLFNTYPHLAREGERPIAPLGG
jgi:hypothetical protein